MQDMSVIKDMQRAWKTELHSRVHIQQVHKPRFMQKF